MLSSKHHWCNISQKGVQRDILQQWPILKSSVTAASRFHLSCATCCCCCCWCCFCCCCTPPLRIFTFLNLILRPVCFHIWAVTQDSNQGCRRKATCCIVLSWWVAWSEAEEWCKGSHLLKGWNFMRKNPGGVYISFLLFRHFKAQNCPFKLVKPSTFKDPFIEG